MTFHLDELLRDDKRDGNLIPDLSKATCKSQEDFRILSESSVEPKMKPDKVKREDIKIRDKEFTWNITQREWRITKLGWSYGNPMPPDMRSLNLNEFKNIAIDWKMLTSLRPKLNQDEKMFSRLVEMAKLHTISWIKDRRLFANLIKIKKNHAGIYELCAKVCDGCEEEFCDGNYCGDISYDSFLRILPIATQSKYKLSLNTTSIISNINKVNKRKKGKKIKIKNKNKYKIVPLRKKEKRRIK